MCQKRPIISEKRPTNTSIPEVCVSAKRDLFMRQKRPIEIGIPEILLALLGVIGSAAVADTQLFSLGNVPRCNQGE